MTSEAGVHRSSSDAEPGRPEPEGSQPGSCQEPAGGPSSSAAAAERAARSELRLRSPFDTDDEGDGHALHARHVARNFCGAARPLTQQVLACWPKLKICTQQPHRSFHQSQLQAALRELL